MSLSLPDWLLQLGAPLELCAKLTVLLVAAGLAARLLRDASAASRHLAWKLGLLAALALPLAILVVPATRLVVPIAERSGEPTSAHEGSSDLTGAPRPDERPVASPEAPAAWRRLRPEGVVAGLWLVVATALLARLATSLVRAALLARGARPATCDDAIARAVSVRESDRVAVPMTYGVLRPVVLVPAGFASWDARRREDVLRHELAHVRRGDWLAQVAARLACALFWFHPLVHLASRRLRDEAEQAADDLVLASGARPSAYASHLVDLVRSCTPHSRSEAMTVSMIGGPFDSRIRAILDVSRARGPASARVRLTLAAAAAACVLLLSAVDVAAEPAARSPWQHVKDAWQAHVDWATTPDDGDEWYERGMQLHAAGRYEDAIAAFGKAIEMGARVGGSSYNVACGMSLLGRPDEAFEWLSKAEAAGFDLAPYLENDEDLAPLRSDARFAALTERHADAMRRDGLERKAQAAYLRVSPDAASPTSLYNEACRLALKGRRDEAMAAFEKAVSAGWSDADYARKDGDLESLRGDARFEKLLADAETLSPPREDGFLSAFVRTEPADWKDARRKHEEFVAAHPDSGAGWFQLGLYRLRTGDPDAGIAAYEKARALGYRPEVAAYNIACGHALAGRADSAFEWLQRASTEGFDVAAHASGDEDLASLRDDERFRPYDGPVRRMLRRAVEY